MQIDEIDRTIKIVDQCLPYSGANIQSQVKIYNIINPEIARRTKSFEIKLQDKNNNGIAEITSGVLYTPIPGEIRDISLESLGGIEIADITDIELRYTPSHDVREGTSYIFLKMPKQMEFGCSIQDTVGLLAPIPCIDLGGNVLRFDDPFKFGRYEGGQPLSMIFKNRVLPGANLMIRGISI